MITTEIRAWDKRNKKMLYIFPNDSVIFKNGKCSIWKENQYNKLEECCCCEVFTDVIPLRCTGLKDQNGTKIYEGDIVKADNGINKVIGIVRLGKYEQDGSGGGYNPVTCIGFYFDRLKTIPNEWERENDYIWEVDCDKTTSLLCYVTLEKIGNIYENPELLEVQE